MRSRTAYTSALLAASLLVGACSAASSEGNAGDQTITYLTIGYPDKDQTDPVTGLKLPGIDKLKAAFKKANPDIDLKIINIPFGSGSTGYAAKTDAMIKANQACLYEMPGALDYGKKGMLVNLKGLIAEDEDFENEWGDGLQQAESWGPDDPDSLFYLPDSTGVRVINWDAEIFEHYGVEPLSVTPTLEEIAEKAPKLTGTDPVTHKKTYGYWYQGKYLAWQFLAIGHAMGADWGQVNDDGTLTIQWDTPEYVQALQWLVDMAKYAPKGALGSDGMPDGFLTDKNSVAIIPDGEAGYFLSPEIADPKLAERFRTSTNVKGPDGRGGLNAFSPLAMAKSCKNKDAAWTAMKWLAGAGGQKYYYEAAGRIPTVTDLAEVAPGIANLPEGAGEAIFKQVQTADGVYPWATTEPRFALESALEAALAGTKTPEEALQQAQQETEKYLKANQ
jgi:ABC-type glycerol-3-phosphate transport system substrate-binding protein